MLTRMTNKYIYKETDLIQTTLELNWNVKRNIEPRVTCCPTDTWLRILGKDKKTDGTFDARFNKEISYTSLRDF